MYQFYVKFLSVDATLGETSTYKWLIIGATSPILRCFVRPKKERQSRFLLCFNFRIQGNVKCPI